MNPVWKIAALAASAFLAACATTPAAAPDLAAYRGDARAGHMLANDLCSGCHDVGRAGPSSASGAPPFRTLLARYDSTKLAAGLQRGVMMSHPDMPKVFLTEKSAKDLIAYLETIEQK